MKVYQAGYTAMVKLHILGQAYYWKVRLFLGIQRVNWDFSPSGKHTKNLWKIIIVYG